MLLTLLFHQIEPKSPEILEEKLALLKQNFSLLLPGNKIPAFKTSLCLTFDDSYVDFYHYLFPLLKKLQIKTLLAVPAGYIVEKARLPIERRLKFLKKKKNLFNPNYKEAFCSFSELKEMAQSGLVEIASHSFYHQDLTDPKQLAEFQTDLKQEIVFSKQFLEQKLNLPINTFVYPYGRFNRKIHNLVQKHYKYALRIGSALNFSWQNISNLTYRINLLSFSNIDRLIKNRHLNFWLYTGKYLINSLRRR